MSALRQWTCDACGQAGVWAKGWKWLGVLGGPTRSRDVGERVDRVLCPACPIDTDHPMLK